jgi:serine/threonine-protein kinase
LFVFAAANVLFWSSIAWLFYIALEPYLRSIWPRMLISWARLLEGRFRDPLIGRDVLVGCLLGIALALVLQQYALAPGWLGLPPPRPDTINNPANELAALRGFRIALAQLLTVHWKFLFYSILYVFTLVLLRLILRRTWAAVAMILFAAVIIFNPSTGNPGMDLVVSAVMSTLTLFVLFRFGLLSAVVGFTLAFAFGGVTLTLDPSAWYFPGSFLLLSAVLGLASYGFYTAAVRRPAFPGSTRA